MADEKEILKHYHLTRNVIENNKILGINKRNIVEAFIFTFLILVIVNVLPFTDLVKIICSLVLGIFTFVFCIVGIKHRSITEIFMAEIQFRQNRRRLHLRGPEYVRKKYRTTITESEDESIAERYYKRFKEYLNDFVERYGEEEGSESN